jgi:MraZ protein
VLRGSSAARVDGKGRVKIPAAFRRLIEEKYGRECFVTSYTGQSVRVFPLPVWIEIEKKLSTLPSTDPSVTRYLNVVSYYGQTASIDAQGRLLIHPLLRQKTGLDGEVSVLGRQTGLEIWNRDKLDSHMDSNPLTDGDWENLARHGL